MKKIFFTLAFVFNASFGFASGNISDKNIIEEKAPIVINFDNSNAYCAFQKVKPLENDNSLYDCTITTGSQIVSNGEVIYEEINSWTITGMSCGEFFLYLMMMH